MNNLYRKDELFKLVACVTFRLKSGRFLMDENVWYLQNYSWNLGSIKEISLESFWYLQVWNLKYLPWHKLQFLHTTYNLLTKSHMEKISSLQNFNFLNWYKLKHTLGLSIDRWGCLLTSSTWSPVFISKSFLVYKLHIGQVSN